MGEHGEVPERFLVDSDNMPAEMRREFVKAKPNFGWFDHS